MSVAKVDLEEGKRLHRAARESRMDDDRAWSLYVTWCGCHGSTLIDELEEARSEVERLREAAMPNDQDAMCGACCKENGIEHRAGCPTCGKDFL